MPKPFVLALAAAVLIAAAPFVTMAWNPILGFVVGTPRTVMYCSLFDIARESQRWPEDGGGAQTWRGGCGFRIIREAADLPGGSFDGRVECALLFALAVLAVLSAKRAQYSWIVALPVAVLGAWVFWALRREIVGFVRTMPGGLEGLRLSSWIRPWPWILLGGAVALLVAASWQSRRIGRTTASRAVREIFE